MLQKWTQDHGERTVFLIIFPHFPGLVFFGKCANGTIHPPIFELWRTKKHMPFLLHCFFFCKLANGPIHPPIWPPLLHPFFIKALLLAPSCDYWAPWGAQVYPRVPPGTPRNDFFLILAPIWVRLGAPGSLPGPFFCGFGTVLHAMSCFFVWVRRPDACIETQYSNFNTLFVFLALPHTLASASLQSQCIVHRGVAFVD